MTADELKQLELKYYQQGMLFLEHGLAGGCKTCGDELEENSVHPFCFECCFDMAMMIDKSQT